MFFSIFFLFIYLFYLIAFYTHAGLESNTVIQTISNTNNNGTIHYFFFKERVFDRHGLFTLILMIV